MANLNASKRYTTTREEREQVLIDKKTPNNKLKLSEYLSQPNVKAFNSIITNKMLTKMRENMYRKGQPQIFNSKEECQQEIEDYFKLCYDYDMIPSVASFSVFIGANKDTVYDHINNRASDYGDLLKSAVSTILTYQETGALSNEVPAVPFIFLGKQYYGFKDNQDITINANNQTNINTYSIDAIKEQISNETPKIIDMK